MHPLDSGTALAVASGVMKKSQTRDLTIRFRAGVDDEVIALMRSLLPRARAATPDWRGISYAGLAGRVLRDHCIQTVEAAERGAG
jgi:hypothetical protein